MKRRAATLYILVTLLLLSGCTGKLFSSRRDMEHLLPVQTLGLDRRGEGVTVSISAGPGPNGAPALVMSASGDTIEAALARLQDFSPEDELFYAHVRYILLGQSMTDGSVLPLLDWVERSPSMRMETPLLLIKGRAEDAVTGASGEMGDVTERLASLEREENARGQHIYTLRQAAASLLERDGALCLAAEVLPAEGTMYTESDPADAIVPAGYAVLRAQGDAARLTEAETLGVQLLTGSVNGTRVELGGTVLDLTGGRSEVRGLRDEDGTLAGLAVRCELTAGILERTGEEPPDIAALQRDLEAAAEGWVLAAVARSQALDCDFLRLEEAVGRTDAAWSYRFPRLSVTAEAEAVIDRSYDLSEG